MTQEPLFKDLLQDRLAAIAADIDAIGDPKAVGHELWPSLTPDTAGRKLSNALNPKQRHQLTDAEVWQIKQLARSTTGRSRIHEFESSALQADLHWITPVELLERKERRIETLLDEVHLELQEWKAARAALRVAK